MIVSSLLWGVLIGASILWAYGVTMHQHWHEMHHFYVGVGLILLALAMSVLDFPDAARWLWYIGASMVVDDALEHLLEHDRRAGPSVWLWLYAHSLYLVLNRLWPGIFV